MATDAIGQELKYDDWVWVRESQDRAWDSKGPYIFRLGQVYDPNKPSYGFNCLGLFIYYEPWWRLPRTGYSCILEGSCMVKQAWLEGQHNEEQQEAGNPK